LGNSPKKTRSNREKEIEEYINNTTGFNANTGCEGNWNTKDILENIT
jgi:hypothetical protein